MGSVLWAKGFSMDEVMRELTVGNDYEIDRHMATSDCIGTAAHVQMLCKVGLLSRDDAHAVLTELKALHELAMQGKLTIPPELEDVHTTLEVRLNEKLGDAGRRIHTGRSRNDQALTTTRLYVRHKTHQVVSQLITVLASFVQRSNEVGKIQMPGYTHMQPAMPSSIGQWLHAHLEAGLWLVREGLFLLEELNTNPLGASAGFGTPLPLDREMTTRLLGFSRVQRSPIDCNNSRGRYEARLLRWSSDVAAVFEKFACDLMLFLTREFGFFSLADELTTGSSIMPQKKNPDLVELLRGRAAKVRAAALEVELITSKLPSSYNRDLQYTKEPLIRGVHELTEILRMADLSVRSFKPQEARLKEAMYTDLYATYIAFHLVQEGMAFRDAYREVAAQVTENRIDRTRAENDFAIIQQQTERGIALAAAELQELEHKVSGWGERIEAVVSRVFVLDS